jgi:predicted dehydrogenase
MQKLRVGIAGVGRAAKAIHIPALRKLSNVEIVGVYDPRQEPSEFPVFGSLDALLSLRPDVVVIGRKLTPSPLPPKRRAGRSASTASSHSCPCI